MKNVLLFLICGFGFITVQGQQIALPEECNKILETKFQNWKLAEVREEIMEYFKENRSFEKPNLINGDWNGDQKTDFAILLEDKNNSEKKIILVFMKSPEGFKNYSLPNSYDCIMSEKKGAKGYDFETKTSFYFKNDVIFGYFWEKGGSSYIWENGKFKAIVTSD